MERRTPTRWEWLWLGYADPDDLAEIDRIRRVRRRWCTLSHILSSVRRRPWAFARNSGCTFAILALVFGPWPMQVTFHLLPLLIAVVSADAYSMQQQARARLPARRIRRSRLRLLFLNKQDRTAELAKRRDFWRTAFATCRPNRYSLPNLGWAYLAAFACLYVFLELSLPQRATSMLYLGCYWGSAAVLPLYTRWQARRDQARFLADECLNCGYPLAELPSDEPHGSPGWLGPERCSECGCPWPAVPPTVTSKPAIVLALRQQAKDWPPPKLPPVSSILKEGPAAESLARESSPR